MSTATLFILALSLSFDSFAVSVCCGLSESGWKQKKRKLIRIPLFFAIFQGLMPIFGWYLGNIVTHSFQQYDHWIALVLLFYLGFKMIKDGVNNNGEIIDNPTGWSRVISLSIATSIDAFAVGVSLAFLTNEILSIGLLIAVVTFVASCLGLYSGKISGKFLIGKAEIVGGILLMLLGVKIFVEHGLDHGII